MLGLLISLISLISPIMATLLIRGLDEGVKRALRIRAAHNGRSMEEEARQILKSTLHVADPGVVRDDGGQGGVDGH